MIPYLLLLQCSVVYKQWLNQVGQNLLLRPFSNISKRAIFVIVFRFLEIRKMLQTSLLSLSGPAQKSSFMLFGSTLSLSLSPKHSQTPTYTPSLSLSHKALSRSHPFTHKLNKPQSRRVTIANSTLLSLREHSLNNIHILLSQTLATTPLSLTFYLINHTHIHSIFHLITPF